MRVIGSVAIAAVVVASAGAQQPGASPTPTGTGVIVGRVVDNRGVPVGRARVNVVGGAVVRELIADEDGEFFLVQLPPGDYWLSASKAGYFAAEEVFRRQVRPRWPIHLDDGERRLDVSLTLWRPASVSGRVTDQAGRPLEGIQVSAAERSVQAGHPRVIPTYGTYNGGVTDDRGEYRLTGIRPGEFAICVSWGVVLTFERTTDDRRPSELWYPTVCHPDAEPDGTPGTFELAGGENLTGIDVRLTPQPVLRVRGILQNTSGLPIGNFMLGTQPGTPRFSYPFNQGLGVDAGGRFTSGPVLPGRYRLMAATRTPSEPTPPDREEIRAVIHTPQGGTMSIGLSQPSSAANTRGVTTIPGPDWTASAIVDVGPGDAPEITIALRRGLRLSGRVEFAGTRPISRADEPVPAHFVLTRASGEGSQLRPRMSADGTFVFENVPPERYVLAPVADWGMWQIARASAGARDLYPLPFEIGDQGLSEITVVMTGRQATLSGRVASAGSSTPPEVFFFPTDERLWTDYGRTSVHMRRWFTDPQGKFQLNLPPGEYFVVATTSPVPEAWQEPARLRWLSRAADVVVMPPEGRVQVSLAAKTLQRPVR